MNSQIDIKTIVNLWRNAKFFLPYFKNISWNWTLKQMNGYIISLLKPLSFPLLPIIIQEMKGDEIRIIKGKHRIDSIGLFFQNAFSINIDEKDKYYKDLTEEEKSNLEQLYINVIKIKEDKGLYNYYCTMKTPPEKSCFKYPECMNIFIKKESIISFSKALGHCCAARCEKDVLEIICNLIMLVDNYDISPLSLFNTKKTISSWKEFSNKTLQEAEKICNLFTNIFGKYPLFIPNQYEILAILFHLKELETNQLSNYIEFFKKIMNPKREDIYTKSEYLSTFRCYSTYAKDFEKKLKLLKKYHKEWLLLKTTEKKRKIQEENNKDINNNNNNILNQKKKKIEEKLPKKLTSYIPSEPYRFKEKKQE